MSITDELREWAHARFAGGFSDVMEREVDEIADRIDERYHRDMATAQQVGINEGEDAAMRDGWVELPKDADGEYIHIGDVMEWPYGNGEFVVEGIGGNTLFYIDKDSSECEWTAAGDKRHHHAPTVEDVLRDMHAKLDEVTALYVGEAIDSDERDSDEARIIAEYAAKLRLAKEDA